MAGYTVNGPRAGKGVGRQRNTLVNMASKQSGFSGVPVVSPGSAVGYGQQIGALQMGLFNTLAGLAAQRGVLQGQFQTSKADIHQTAIQGIGGAESQALQSGILGSSIDAGNRTAVRATAASSLQDAIQTRAQGILGLQQQRIQAQNQYLTGVFNVLAQKRAEQAQMANQAFLNDLVLRMQQGGAAGTGPGVPGATTLNPQQQGLLQSLMNQLANMNASGVPVGYGQMTPGHVRPVA